MTAVGHEDAFAPTTTSNRSCLGKPTFAGTRGNEQDALIADRGGLKRGRQQSTHSGRSVPSIAMPAHGAIAVTA